MNNPTVRDRILDQIRRSLCSQHREREWQELVEGLRPLGRDVTNVPDALNEFLSNAAESGPLGTSFLSPTDYRNLSDSEKLEVDALYRECLETAMRDFPEVFQAK